MNIKEPIHESHIGTMRVAQVNMAGGAQLSAMLQSPLPLFFQHVCHINGTCDTRASLPVMACALLPPNHFLHHHIDIHLTLPFPTAMITAEPDLLKHIIY